MVILHLHTCTYGSTIILKAMTIVMHDSKKLILVKIFICLIAKDYDVSTIIIIMLALTQLLVRQP